MTKSLFLQAIGKVTLGFASVLALIFFPAGDWRWQEGWRLIGILFIPMVCAGAVMMVKSPALLRKRLKAKEARQAQSLVIQLSGLMFLAGFLLAGLDHRFGWSQLPDWVSMGASLLLLVGYCLYAEVMRENAYLSRTIEIQEGQKLVDTGLYGIVRHPMYSATLLLFLSIPLVLGSLPAFMVFLSYPAIIAKRIQNEEQLLIQELEGYGAYTQRVRWRLVPYIW